MGEDAQLRLLSDATLNSRDRLTILCRFGGRSELFQFDKAVDWQTINAHLWQSCRASIPDAFGELSSYVVEAEWQCQFRDVQGVNIHPECLENGAVYDISFIHRPTFGVVLGDSFLKRRRESSRKRSSSEVRTSSRKIKKAKCAPLTEDHTQFINWESSDELLLVIETPEKPPNAAPRPDDTHVARPEMPPLSRSRRASMASQRSRHRHTSPTPTTDPQPDVPTPLSQSGPSTTQRGPSTTQRGPPTTTPSSNVASTKPTPSTSTTKSLSSRATTEAVDKKKKSRRSNVVSDTPTSPAAEVVERKSRRSNLLVIDTPTPEAVSATQDGPPPSPHIPRNALLFTAPSQSPSDDANFSTPTLFTTPLVTPNMAEASNHLPTVNHCAAPAITSQMLEADDDDVGDDEPLLLFPGDPRLKPLMIADAPKKPQRETATLRRRAADEAERSALLKRVRDKIYMSPKTLPPRAVPTPSVPLRSVPPPPPPPPPPALPPPPIDGEFGSPVRNNAREEGSLVTGRIRQGFGGPSRKLQSLISSSGTNTPTYSEALPRRGPSNVSRPKDGNETEPEDSCTPPPNSSSGGRSKRVVAQAPAVDKTHLPAPAEGDATRLQASSVDTMRVPAAVVMGSPVEGLPNEASVSDDDTPAHHEVDRTPKPSLPVTTKVPTCGKTTTGTLVPPPPTTRTTTAASESIAQNSKEAASCGGRNGPRQENNGRGIVRTRCNKVGDAIMFGEKVMWWLQPVKGER